MLRFENIILAASLFLMDSGSCPPKRRFHSDEPAAAASKHHEAASASLVFRVKDYKKLFQLPAFLEGGAENTQAKMDNLHFLVLLNGYTATITGHESEERSLKLSLVKCISPLYALAYEDLINLPVSISMQKEAEASDKLPPLLTTFFIDIDGVCYQRTPDEAGDGTRTHYADDSSGEERYVDTVVEVFAQPKSPEARKAWSDYDYLKSRETPEAASSAEGRIVEIGAYWDVASPDIDIRPGTLLDRRGLILKTGAPFYYNSIHKRLIPLTRISQIKSKKNLIDLPVGHKQDSCLETFYIDSDGTDCYETTGIRTPGHRPSMRKVRYNPATFESQGYWERHESDVEKYISSRATDKKE